MTAPIAAAFVRQKDRLFLWVPVFLGLGIALYMGLKTEPPVWPALAILGFCAAGAVAGRRHLAVLIIFALIACVALGFSLAQWRAYHAGTIILAKQTGPRMVEGTIIDIERLAPGKGERVILDHVVIERLNADATPRKIRMRLREGSDIRAGQRIRVLGSVMPPSSPAMPGGFDFQRYLFFKGIGGTGFAYKQPEIIDAAAKGGVYIAFEDARQIIAKRTAQMLHPAYAPFGIAMLTGQQAAVAEKDRAALRDSGLAHLLAISGMNIGMIYGAVFFLLRLCMAAIPPLALTRPIKKYAAVGSFIAAALYTAIVGGDIPVMRALVMAGVITIAILIDRSPFSPRLLAFAAIVLLVFAPENLINVSFQLSFAAVAALIFFFDSTREFWIAAYSRAGIARRVFFYIASVLATTFVAGMATAPFILYHFQNFPVYSMLANLIGVPIMGFVVMPAAVFIYILMPLGLEKLPMEIMEWGIGWTLATAHWTAGLDGAVWHVRTLPIATFALSIVGMLIMLLWHGRGKYGGLALIFGALAIAIISPAPDILVSESFKLMAVRGHDGNISVSTGRAERFTGRRWVQMNGEGEAAPPSWPKEGHMENANMMCGPEGCRAEINGKRSAFPRTHAAIKEDCAWADIIIARTPLPKHCAATLTLDLYDGRRNGAHAIYIGANDVRVITARDVHGDRPWTRYLSD